MGATLSLQAPHAQTVAIRSYVDVLQDYQFLEIINNTRFLKSIKAYDPKTRALLVIKVFIKPPQTAIDLKALISNIAQEASILSPYSNILAWNNILETDSAGYLVRQLARTNLYDRLSMAPFLTAPEKLWFVYQLLRILAIIHEECGVVHGDLKTENLLVTGGNWLLLTDFSAHTKPRVLPENNPSEYAFYFDSSNRRTCYLAPERFYAGTVEETASAPAHDLFSLGCVVMELYHNGEPTFTLSDLYKYKKGEYSVNVQAVPNHMQNMVASCLDLDPEKRPPAHVLLENPIFPSYFDGFLYGFLYGLNTSDRFESNDPNKSASDARIEYIWAEYGNICEALGIDTTKATNEEAANEEAANEEAANEAVNEEAANEEAANEKETGFPHYRLRLPGMESHCIRARGSKDFLNNGFNKGFNKESNDESNGFNKESNKESNNGSNKESNNRSNDDSNNTSNNTSNITSNNTSNITNSPNVGCLIILNTVLSLVTTLQRPENKIKACELILALSEYIDDDAKLDRSVPYLCQFFDDFVVEIGHNVDMQEQEQTDFPGTCHVSSRVASVALVAVTNVLESCTWVNSINSHIFPDYLVPKLRALAFMSSRFQHELDHVKKTLAMCFPYLVRISDRFEGFSRTTHEKGNLEADISEITEALLTSSNVDIRIGLINNLLPLCQYFGVDKTNDVILPHLITYLNDSSFQLRLAFLSSLIGIGNFIGVLAFEQYLIPLLLQTLGDHEALVVLKALEIFQFFVQEKLIMAEFNALSIYKELLKSSLPLLVQPNEWIRQSVTCLVLAVSDNLSDADKFCFLYPMIKTYLGYDISVLSWETLYPCLVKPLSQPVFDLALTWLHKSTQKSLFWKQKQVSIVKANGKKRLVSYSKDLGRSVYAESAYSGESSNSDLALSNEDRSWVSKLKSVGMDVKDLWKVFCLKDHLAGISRSRSYSETGHQRNFELASTMNIPPKTVFFEVRYKTESMIEKGKRREFKDFQDFQGTDQGTDQETDFQKNRREFKDFQESQCQKNRRHFMDFQESDFQNAIRNESAAMSVVPKKACASLQTSQANAFGEIDSHESVLHQKHMGSAHLENPGTTRMFCISNDKIITSTMKHNFGGSNPYILKYLENMKFEPTLDDFEDFGPPAKSSKDFATFSAVQGKVVARFKNNSNTNSIEAVSQIAVAPYSEFFVTGSETGILRVWDASKVETLSSSSARLSLDVEGSITAISFMPQRFVFAASTSQGKVGIFKVHVVRGKNRKIIKLSKISAIRDFVLAQGYATALKFVEIGPKTLLVALTTKCSVVGFDVITSKKDFELSNPAVYGVPQTLIVNSDWLLLGTGDGILCLWDMRFRILLKAWKLKMDHGDHAAIKKLEMVPKDPKDPKSEKKSNMFAMIGGSHEPDVTIWGIPDFECRQVMSSSSTPKIKKYHLERLEKGYLEKAERGFLDKPDKADKVLLDKPDSLLDKVEKTLLDKVDKVDMVDAEKALSQLMTLTLNLDPTVNHANTCLVSSSGKDSAHLVTATADKRVVVWDMKNIQHSESMCGKSTFYHTQVTRDLSVCYEKKESHEERFDDEITAIGVLERGQQMVVVGDRSGCLNIFR